MLVRYPHAHSCAALAKSPSSFCGEARREIYGTCSSPWARRAGLRSRVWPAGSSPGSSVVTLRADWQLGSISAHAHCVAGTAAAAPWSRCGRTGRRGALSAHAHCAVGNHVSFLLLAVTGLDTRSLHLAKLLQYDPLFK